jgi:hypothetical protein
MLLLDTGLEGVYIAAERARVEAMAEPHAMSPSGIVTVSTGVASLVPSPVGVAGRAGGQGVVPGEAGGANSVEWGLWV